MSRRTSGRPPVTSHAAIEHAAFQLFEERGFDSTTMDDIASALGVGRRTLFRYYPSKNDILWGQFDDSLRSFERTFQAMDPALPISDAIRDAIIAFNRLDEDAIPQHRQRMRLLLNTPTLLAHSELRYATWRHVVSDYVAARLDLRSDDLLPQLAGRVSLAIALTAYGQWLDDDNASLEDLLAQAARGLSLLFGN